MKMKRLLILLLVLLVGCSSSAAKEIKYLTPFEVTKKVDDKESFFLVIGNTTCAGCIQYKPVLEEFVKNKEADIFYLEVDVEGAKSDESRAEIIRFFEDYLDDKINHTPTTMYFENGEMVEHRVGPIKYTQLVEWVEGK